MTRRAEPGPTCRSRNAWARASANTSPAGPPRTSTRQWSGPTSWSASASGSSPAHNSPAVTARSGRARSRRRRGSRQRDRNSPADAGSCRTCASSARKAAPESDVQTPRAGAASPADRRRSPRPGRGEIFVRVLETGVQQDAGLRAPPAAEGVLGHSGPYGDALHGDARGALLDEQVVGRLRHGRPGLLDPAVPIAVMRPFRTGCHLAPLGREFAPEGGREPVEDALRRMAAQAEQDDAVAERIDWGSGPKPMSPRNTPTRPRRSACRSRPRAVNSSTARSVPSARRRWSSSGCRTGSPRSGWPPRYGRRSCAGRHHGTQQGEDRHRAAHLRRDRPGRPDHGAGGRRRDSLAGLDAPVGLVLPDGWRDLCLPVPKTLEPRLATGMPVVGDSSFASTRPCPDHVGARSRCGPPARKSARRRRRAAILHR